MRKANRIRDSPTGKVGRDLESCRCVKGRRGDFAKQNTTRP